METWLPPNGTVIIHGDCQTGADRIVDDWCVVHWVRCERFPPDWDFQRMIDEGKPDKALGFPGGRGTADMTRRLKAAGIPLAVFEH
jgi:hypothetical protein